MAESIAAISTGLAPGGIGVIRISGDDAIDIASKVFVPIDNSNINELGGYRAKFGNVICDGQKSDNAVATVFREPKSYTGENVVEISVHGGILMVQKTLEAVIDAGARPAGPGEFTKRAFVNGKMDLTQAESVASMISAQGEDALKASYNALQGNLSQRINEVISKLSDCSATMAAWVDYPDEEIPELSEDSLMEMLVMCRDTLKQLLDGYDNGQIIENGIDTVIAGKPNAGKSSIMNYLTGREKSIVTQVKGTTRDIVEDTIRLGSLILHLRDTAGIRETDDIVESIGVEKTYKAISSCQLVLAVFDSSLELSDEDKDLIKQCKNKKCVALINKTDLEQNLDIKTIESSFDSIVYMSAKEEQGANELRETLLKMFSLEDFDSSAPLLANARQKNNCQKAYNGIIEAIDALDMQMTYDAINVSIDTCLDELLSLTGRKATEEVVNNIFSKFCVGK